MPKTHTLILGGSGLIGSHLCRAWIKDNVRNGSDFESDLGVDLHEVYVLSRNKKSLPSLPSVRVVNSFASLPDVQFTTIINLTGATVGKRWTNSYKQILRESRIDTTENLVTWLKARKKKPKVWLQASAIGYYGARSDATPLHESSTVREDFIHELCKDWEDAAVMGKPYVERQCILRIGVVLARDGGMIKDLKTPLSLGMGGRFGDGQQILSWIAMTDLVNALTFLRDHGEVEGTFNATSPHPISNEAFIQCAAKILKRPAFLHMPRKVVQMLFGEMGELLLLKGQYVIPQRLMDAGFVFQSPKLEDALRKALLPSAGIAH